MELRKGGYRFYCILWKWFKWHPWCLVSVSGTITFVGISISLRLLGMGFDFSIGIDKDYDEFFCA